MKNCKGVGIVLVLLLGIGLSGCAGDGTLRLTTAAPAPYPPPGYAHRVETANVGIFWNCSTPEPGVLRLEGLAFNIWSAQPVRFLEFGLAGVNAQERTVSEASGEARDIQILTWQSTPFELALRPAGSETRYDLYWQYQFTDTSNDRLISGPMVSGSFPRRHGNTFLARDACSPTQHLAR